MTQDIDELEDFDIPPASYEVWVLGYDRFDMPTGFELLVGSFTNPDAAVDRAKALMVPDIAKENDIQDEVSYFSIEVETAVVLSSDEVSNVGTIYRRSLENTKPAVDIHIKDTDYDLTETGNLRIICDIAKRFEIGDYLNVSIIGRETPAVLLKVFEKDPWSITCEFID